MNFSFDNKSLHFDISFDSENSVHIWCGQDYTKGNQPVNEVRKFINEESKKLELIDFDMTFSHDNEHVKIDAGGSNTSTETYYTSLKLKKEIVYSGLKQFLKHLSKDDPEKDG